MTHAKRSNSPICGLLLKIATGERTGHAPKPARLIPLVTEITEGERSSMESKLEHLSKCVKHYRQLAGRRLLRKMRSPLLPVLCGKREVP